MNIETLKKLQADGHRLILWTYRCGVPLEEAVAFCKSKGIEFAALLHQPAVALSIDPKDKKGRSLLEAVLKGSSADLDEWLVTKNGIVVLHQNRFFDR